MMPVGKHEPLRGTWANHMHRWRKGIVAHQKRKRTSSFNFNEALHLMHKHDPQLQADGFGLLSAHAPENVDRLIAEFHTETEHGLRCRLLELIGDAKSPTALPLLLEYLQRDDGSLRWWAMRGLNKGGSPCVVGGRRAQVGDVT
jgi:hypothetical protein